MMMRSILIIIITTGHDIGMVSATAAAMATVTVVTIEDMAETDAS
jgi:hypothetical protein